MVPLNSYVILEPVQETVSRGGILLPENKQANKGKVLSCSNTIIGLKKGDIVLFEPYSATEHSKKLFVKFENLLGKL